MQRYAAHLYTNLEKAMKVVIGSFKGLSLTVPKLLSPGQHLDKPSIGYNHVHHGAHTTSSVQQCKEQLSLVC